MEAELNVLSLREQVYTYLRKQMNMGALLPGSTINIGEIAKQLGISKTPLRDALIHLEIEGFVTILPRRGVRVNVLDLQDVKNAYNAIGMVESSVIIDCFDKIESAHILKLEALNEKMMLNIEKNNFNDLFNTNLQFHDIFLELSDNELLKKFVLPIKHRLYDFPRQNYISEWEMRNCKEHELLISYLKQKHPKEAAGVLKDSHWSYEYSKEFIKQFYNMDEQ